MRILVTGSAGFIGYHLTRRLLDGGAEVIGLDNLNDYYTPVLKAERLALCGIDAGTLQRGKLQESKRYPAYRFIQEDLTNAQAIQTLMENESPELVCHLAAQAGVRYSLQNPAAYIQSNIAGFLAVLEGCRSIGVRHLVYASSSSVYGLNRSIPFRTNDQVDHPVSLYAATKKADELMAHTYSHLYNLPTTGLRFFTVYGPYGRPDMSPMLFAKAILDGTSLQVFNHGKMARDFTYVGDVVEALVRVLNCPAVADPDWSAERPDPASSCAPYRIHNIGRGAPVDLLEYIAILERAFGRKAKLELLPMQQGDVAMTYADTSSLEALTGYRPATDLADGIAVFAQWYRQYHKGLASS